MQTDYRPDDKDWLKQRRANWKYIKQSIRKHLAFTRPNEYPGMRDYYITGEMNQTVADNRCTTLFELWLHPDQSEARWQGLWQELLNRYSGTATPGRSFKKSREEFFRAALRSPCDPEFGVFGGMEERLLAFFLPIERYTDDTFTIENRPQRLCYFPNPKELYTFFFYGNYTFLTEADENIFYPFQYLIDFWFTSMEHSFELSKRQSDYCLLFFKEVLKTCEMSVQERHPNKIAFARRLKEALDSRELKYPAKALWEAAKS